MRPGANGEAATRARITIPASTSNLGASFDTCGLALGIYLRVTVDEVRNSFEIVPSGEGADKVPRDESNLIARVARARKPAGSQHERPNHRSHKDCDCNKRFYESKPFFIWQFPIHDYCSLSSTFLWVTVV